MSNPAKATDAKPEPKGGKENIPHGKRTVPDHFPLPLISANRAWSVSAVRGKITDRCLWTVCKALTAGVFLILIGAGMATIGYYSDTLSTVEERRGNTTLLIKNEYRDSHLNSLTYLGPIIMGIGGFIIVAACVMTFEARDTTAKIVPIWFRKTRIQVEPGSGSNISGRSSQTSWERFLVRTRRSKCEDSSRTSMTKAFMNFSKYIQSSMDAGKISPGVNRNIHEKLRKCPSEPTMNIQPPNPKDHIHPSPEGDALLMAEKTRLSLVPPDQTGVKPRSFMAVPQLYRQAMSIDCPRGPPLHADQVVNEKPRPRETPITKISLFQERTNVNRCDSSGSMALELYLPQGAVTLKVKDETRKPCERSYSHVSPANKSSVGRRRSMSQGTKDAAEHVAKVSGASSARSPPQVSRENSSARTTPHVSRESSCQSPKAGCKHNRDHTRGSPRTPRPSRENSSSSPRSTPKLTRGDSSPSSAQRSVEQNSPKSRLSSRMSSEHSGSETKVSILTDCETPSREIVMQEIPPRTHGNTSRHLEKQQTEIECAKRSLRDLSGTQSSTMKRHPFMRQKAVDPPQSKDNIQNN